MPRNMSFMLTTEQIRNRTKTVTRRLGWKFLKVGDVVNACVKCQGIPKGESIEKICQIRIRDVRREPLNAMIRNDDEAAREGFPNLTAVSFVAMFCVEMGCDPVDEVTRIEFEYLDSPDGGDGSS